MLLLLINLAVMGAVLGALLKAYYELPFLHNNPEMSGGVALVVLLVFLWIFPKLIWQIIKFALFAFVVFLICQKMGWNVDKLRSAPSEMGKKLEEQAQQIKDAKEALEQATQAADELADRVTSSYVPVKVSGVLTGGVIEVDGKPQMLYGIDAPDLAQFCREESGRSYSCGLQSQRELNKMLRGQKISCARRGKNKVACQTEDGSDVAAMMLHSGWAVADKSAPKEYKQEEKSAYLAKVGLWQGKFQAPWDWRQKNPEKATDYAKELDDDGAESKGGKKAPLKSFYNNIKSMFSK